MRLRTLTGLIALLALSACDDDGAAITQSIPGAPQRARIETSMGVIQLELFPDRAPITVHNFRQYAQEGFYDSLLVHRVIAGFIVQGGGLTVDMEPSTPTHEPIVNEAKTAPSNRRGTIAMARTSDPNSATSQFFINLEDNLFLDYRADTPQGAGYAVFGRVVSGMEVVDEIAGVPTGSVNGFNDVPLTPIVIFRIETSPGWP